MRFKINSPLVPWLAGALIVLAVVLAYANSFSGSFVYDDRTAIEENASIRQLWPPSVPLSPPANSGTGGRPLANLTFAVSHAVSGLEPWGYHLLNIGIHALAALALFGVVRRTLMQPALRERLGGEATPLALCIALLWAVHPLQTQAVTYVSQRTESLMAVFYLLTLYCFIRSGEQRTLAWRALAVVSCLAGAFCKEVIATAPLMVLLYDRTFVAGSFVGALRSRWRFYAALSSSWIVLAIALAGVRIRGVGYGLGFGWFEYGLTQCKAVLLYLTLPVWPSPLVFDRGIVLLKTLEDAAPYAAVVALALVGSAWALARRPAWGFLCAWFLVILAPTSSVVPVIQQPIAENRAYLPSAAVIAIIVLGVRYLAGLRTALIGGSLAALAALGATHMRNRDYASPVSLWMDTAEKAPLNARAPYNVGVHLAQSGREADALAWYETALRMVPDYAEARFNLGFTLRRLGRRAEAIGAFQAYLKLKPDAWDAQALLGSLLIDERRYAEAEEPLQAAIRLKPDCIDAYYNLGNAFLWSDRAAQAVGPFEAALRIDPRQAKVRTNLGVAFFQLGRKAEAQSQWERSIELDPTRPDPHNNLAVLLSGAGRIGEAIAHLETALKLSPDDADTRRNLDALRKSLPGGNAAP